MEIRRITLHRFVPMVTLAVLFSSVANAATTSLPIEVVGENGATSSASVDVPARFARQVRTLWLQIHNLSYADMVSIQVNNSTWLSLNNNTVAVAEPGKSFGGIGGGFSTLKLTMTLPADAVVEGPNTIRFRFNRTDGLVSGFRVLAFNFLTGDSSRVLGPEAFTQDDPSTWTPPLRDSNSIRSGEELWRKATLAANSLPNAPDIRAHCADCHAHDGRDLKYFNFSNASIVARSRFHGLSELQGQQIASYIRSLSIPNPGRPWNPPYQPGPGVEAQPVANWAAGAGLAWVIDDDAALPFIFLTAGDLAGRSAEDAPRITPNWNGTATNLRNTFRPDGNLNPREIPISLQLPDWNHWLPRVHPLDAWGLAFEKSEFLELYGSVDGGTKNSLRNILASRDLSATIKSGRIVTQFEKWRNARRTLLKPFVESKGMTWSPDLANKAYSTQLWQLVKTWEMTEEFDLEGRGRELFGTLGESRTWFNAIPAATAPAAVNIPDGPSGMGGSALTNEYFNASWYQLQVLLNSGNHQHHDRFPVDWIYLISAFQDLYRETHIAEPARLLVTLIKAMQSTDPSIGPEVLGRGWRPNQNVDPTIMVSDVWAPIFQPIPTEAMRAITESFLASWLEKNRQYSLARYFRGGSENGYALPASLGGIYGGKVWDAAPLFTAAGVNSVVVKQLQDWGKDYTDVAARFQYSPKSSPR